MRKKKSRISVLALLVFLAGTAVIAAQNKSKSMPNRGNATLVKFPHITEVLHQIIGEPPPEMRMRGTNFGAVKGTKNVTIDGTLVTSYILGWYDTSVDFNPPFKLVYWDHVYQFAIVDEATVISNLFYVRFPWDFDAMIPKEGPPGTEVEITVYYLGPTPNGLVLQIGNHDFPVLSWTGGGTYGKIRAKVPTGLAAGLYNVNLKKGGAVASETYQFKVTPPLPPGPIQPIEK